MRKILIIALLFTISIYVMVTARNCNAVKGTWSDVR